MHLKNISCITASSKAAVMPKHALVLYQAMASSTRQAAGSTWELGLLPGRVRQQQGGQ